MMKKVLILFLITILLRILSILLTKYAPTETWIGAQTGYYVGMVSHVFSAFAWIGLLIWAFQRKDVKIGAILIVASGMFVVIGALSKLLYHTSELLGIVMIFSIPMQIIGIVIIAKGYFNRLKIQRQ